MTLIKDIDVKVPVMLLINYALILLFMYLNDAVASFGIYFFCGALFVIPPALFLGFWGMCTCLVVGGFLYEQGLPVEGGMLPAIFLLAGLFLFKIREKFRSLDPAGILALSWMLNAAIYLAACVFAFQRGIDPWWHYLTRTAADLIFSSMVIVLLANFTIRLYWSVFYVIGINLAIPEDAA